MSTRTFCDCCGKEEAYVSLKPRMVNPMDSAVEECLSKDLCKSCFMEMIAFVNNAHVGSVS